MDSTRSLRWTAIVLGLSIFVLNVAGAGLWRDQAWGAHLYGFLPAPAGWGAAGIFLAAAFLLARDRNLIPSPVLARLGFWSQRRGFVLASALVSIGVFWLLRIQHDLLGDALPLTHDLPRGIDTHPRQPLAMWVQQQIYQVLGPFFETRDREPAEVAAHAVALGSAVCGGLFVALALRLGSWLTPRARGAGWFAALLLAQGSSLLFFGYLENYTIYLLAVGAFLLAGVGFLQERLPLWVTGLVVAVSLGLHLSSFVLWPGFLFLVVGGLRNRRRRAATVRDLAITGACVAVLAWTLRAIDPEFALGRAMSNLVALGRGSQGVSYLLSARHLRDFSQEMLLVGPLSLVFFVPACAGWLRRPGADSASTFLFLTALTCLAATFAADEPLLGYARDWDLFVPALLPLLVVTIAWWVRRVAASESGTRMASFLLVLSLLTFLPWIAVNRSESRSLERMARLPLGLGREAVVVGNWHLRHGDAATAASWFERALQEHPGNNNALNLLGNILLQRGQVDRALALYEQAIALRPRKVEYRDKIARVLADQRRYEDSYPHFEALLRETPGDGGAWLRYAQALREGGRLEESRQTYLRAAEALEKELARDPESYSLNMDLGTVYASMGRPAEAEPYLRRAVQAQPGSATALYQLAGVLVETSRAQEARAYLERLLEVDPGHPQRRAIEEWLASMPR